MGIWKNAKWLNFEQRFINISEPGEILTARLYDDVVASNLKQHYDNWRLCFKLMFSIIVAAIILLVLCFQFHCVSIWLVLIIIMTFVPIQCIASQNAIQYRCLLEPQLPALLVNTPRILLGEENNRGAGEVIVGPGLYSYMPTDDPSVFRFKRGTLVFHANIAAGAGSQLKLITKIW